MPRSCSRWTATVLTNSAPGSRLPPLVAAPTSVAWMSRRSRGEEERVGRPAGVEHQARGAGRVRDGSSRPATTCWSLTWNFHGVAGGRVGDHVARLERVEVHEVAHVVGQEDRGARPRPARPTAGSCPTATLSSWSSVPSSTGACRLMAGMRQDARELPLLDARAPGRRLRGSAAAILAWRSPSRSRGGRCRRGPGAADGRGRSCRRRSAVKSSTTPRRVTPTRRTSLMAVIGAALVSCPAASARNGIPPSRSEQFAAPVPAASASPSRSSERSVLLSPLFPAVSRACGSPRLLDRAA